MILFVHCAKTRRMSLIFERLDMRDWTKLITFITEENLFKEIILNKYYKSRH